MLFKMPQQSDLDSLKHMNRKFEDFYLPSLAKLIKTFKRVVLWCDQETATYIKNQGLSKNVHLHIIDFKDLPHYKERGEYLDILKGMQGNVGYLFHKKTPESWLDYLTVILAKPWVMEWAAKNNFFKTEYFMWIDAGALNPLYEWVWQGWNGNILAKPERVRITISPTLGKTRPHFVPNFIYRLYKKLQGPIPPATQNTLVKQKLLDIAMINADYDVPGCSFMANGKMVHKFYHEFERVRLIMKKHGLVSTEQAVFQAMMKFDTDNMFELSYVYGYTGVYTSIAKEKPDYLL